MNLSGEFESRPTEQATQFKAKPVIVLSPEEETSVLFGPWRSLGHTEPDTEYVKIDVVTGERKGPARLYDGLLQQGVEPDKGDIFVRRPEQESELNRDINGDVQGYMFSPVADNVLPKEKQKRNPVDTCLPDPLSLEPSLVGKPGIIVKDPAIAAAFLEAAAFVQVIMAIGGSQDAKKIAQSVATHLRKIQDLVRRLTIPSEREQAKREAITYIKSSSLLYEKNKGEFEISATRDKGKVIVFSNHTAENLEPAS